MLKTSKRSQSPPLLPFICHIQYAIVSYTVDSFSVQKKFEVPVVRPTNLSAELYDEWMNIDEKTQTTKVITEEDICGKFNQSDEKRVLLLIVTKMYT